MKLFKIVAIIMALALTTAVFAACGGSSGSTDSADTNEATETAAAEEAKTAEVGDVDYADIALTIEDGDFDAMVKFLDSWGEGTYDNKVIKVTGINAQRMSNCTVSENDGNGTGRGFSWEIIDGKFPDDYPADDAKVTLTGVLKITDEYGSRALLVPADNVEVAE